jgi:hypothetical protein
MYRIGRSVAIAIILGCSIALAGLFAGMGFARGRSADRYVTVKGVSEREVQADLAIWPLSVVSTDDDLARVHEKLQRSVQLIQQFLNEERLDTSQVALQDFSVSDARANQYGPGAAPGSRFVVRQRLVVRSTNVEQILRASQNVGRLVQDGVVLGSGNEYGGSTGPTFLFTKLNTLKPEMIAEATARAREAAVQFARDSRTSLGPIRTANQGVFEILPRDQAMGISQESQIVKTVRVVSTVEYLLR